MTLVSFLRRLGLLAVVAALLVLPASASALSFHIVNESGRPANEVFVDIAANGAFEVEGFANDEPRALSEIPNGEVNIAKLVSGRVYVSYGAPVQEKTLSFQSPTRFDWAELTVTPSSTDAANLTAVNQFAIGMRLSTFGAGGEELESTQSTYANTIFDALQGIPGGPESTVRGANGEIVRVLSPDTPGSNYPPLTQYVESMAGQTITLHSAFFHSPFVTSEYTGTFGADGSITLNGRLWEEVLGEEKTVEENPAPTIHFEGQKLIEDIYTGKETPNTLEGAVRRDILVGFTLGLWGGKYGNDALSFCTPHTTFQGTWCPNGFTVPAFAEARATPAAFPAYEQYAGVIHQFTNIYGTPYSDAGEKVQVGLDQERVKTLQLTILPDSPPTPPNDGGSTSGGNSSGGSPKPAPSASSPRPASQVTFKLAKTTKLERGKLAVGQVDCKGACGKVVAQLRPKRGKGVIARETVMVRGPKCALTLKPTKLAGRLLRGKSAVPAKLSVTVTQSGHLPATKTVPLRVTN
jgi:hypothetical protein